MTKVFTCFGMKIKSNAIRIIQNIRNSLYSSLRIIAVTRDLFDSCAAAITRFEKDSD